MTAHTSHTEFRRMWSDHSLTLEQIGAALGHHPKSSSNIKARAKRLGLPARPDLRMSACRAAPPKGAANSCEVEATPSQAFSSGDDAQAAAGRTPVIAGHAALKTELTGLTSCGEVEAPAGPHSPRVASVCSNA